MEVFISSFFKANNEARNRMLNKLREISHSISSSLVDPLEKLLIQRRMKQKFDNSMCRNPCAFELVASKVDRFAFSMKSVRVPKKTRQRKLAPQRPSKKEVFVNQVLES